MANLLKFGLWLGLLLIVFLAWVKYVEKHSIFFPMQQISIAPDSAGLVYEDVYFETSDNKKLNGWFISNDKAGFTVIFCHGNAGNISHRLEKVTIFYNLGLSVFIFDYRGYGKSSGAPSEPGVYKDVRAAYDYLLQERKIPDDKIIVYGESLGGAAAIDLAGRQAVKALITEDTFTSVKDMVREAYPFLPPFVLSTKFDSIPKIKAIKCPKLIIHSIDDEIVPFYLGRKLFDAAAMPKQFLEIRGGHNTAFLDSEAKFKDGLKSFLDGLQN